MIQADEVTSEFLVESHENLDQLDRDFVALEADPSAHERIAAIFRTIHTIKGTAGFLGFSRLGALTHGGESLLALLRDGSLALTPEITSALLAMVDRVRAMLRSIEQTGGEGQYLYEDVLERLMALRGPETGAAPADLLDPSGITVWATPPSTAVGTPNEPLAPAATPSAAPSPSPASRPTASLAKPPAPGPDAERRNEPVVEKQPRSSAAEHLQDPQPAPRDDQSGGMGNSALSDSTVRVDVALLDKLMNLVGELVLARNQIVQFGGRVEDPGFVGAAQRLNLITTELQEHVMKTRMQPIGNVWAKLPRVVRDLAVQCGKQVRIEMLGKETELDRTILEAIKDPLTHVVRNAVDHGIETPELRATRGKPRTGTLVLKAFHEGGQVNIEITDDGAGLKLDAIRSKAVERGLVAAERAARLSNHELAQLVFLPGFSTAAQVTNVSGRGVGMDVVKTNIEKIGGTVDLVSAHGGGTTLKIKIPLTLAIVPALIVSSAGQRYAIPQVNLLELVRLEGEARSAIQRIHGTPVYRLRGKLLPLVFLNEELRASATAPASDDSDGDSTSTNIVVLQADDRQFGLVVDQVRDTEEIVVKPLGKELKGITVYQGATIMGDGRVALILDILGLAQHAGAVGRARDQTRNESEKRRAATADSPRGDERQALLLFSVGTESVMALPLSMVARIEEFPRERLERAGNRMVVQYRREILPLIDLSEAVGGRAADSGPSVQVIVYSEHGRSVGFVVGRILDVVEDSVHVERCTAQRGLLGAAVIQDRVTDLLDVEGVIKAQHPAFFEGKAA
jgi:two-component system, chemotaxis family, sensor kinase CheA